MFQYLGRTASVEVFMMPMKIFSAHGPRIFCLASLLSHHSIPSSPFARGFSPVDDCLGPRNLRVPIAQRNSEGSCTKINWFWDILTNISATSDSCQSS